MTEDVVADLARLKEIAEEGRRQPLLGGKLMMLWGCAVMAALLLSWCVATQILPWPPISYSIIWFGMMMLAAVIGRTPGWAGRRGANGRDVGNRVEAAVWTYGGSFLGLVSVSIFVAAMLRLQLDRNPALFDLFATMPPISFGVYAIALRGTAEAANLPALNKYAKASLAFVVITALLAGTTWQFLAAALGIFVVAILPARLLMSLEQQANHG
jgi:hypothetical protein